MVEEMARTMFHESKLSNLFSVQAIETIIHILKRRMLKRNSGNTPNELWKRRSTNVKNFRVLGSK